MAPICTPTYVGSFEYGVLNVYFSQRRGLGDGVWPAALTTDMKLNYLTSLHKRSLRRRRHS